MKTISGASFGAFCLSMFAALPAGAFTVQSRSTKPTDTTHINADIQVTNGGVRAAVGGDQLRYYVYLDDPAQTLAASATSGTVSVTRLDKTYTNTTTNANWVVTITIPANTNTPFTTSLTVTANKNGAAQTPTQTDDWSYLSNTAYANNPNITLQQANNTTSTLWGNWPTQDRNVQNNLLRQKIKHIIVIMQENRSYDNYFGTFPAPANAYVYPTGAAIAAPDGVSNAPAGLRTAACNGKSYSPGVLTSTVTPDLPHDMPAAKYVFGCPSPAAPDRTCSPVCGSDGHACADTEPLSINNFFAANVAEGIGCTDANYQATVGHFDGSASTAPVYNYWTLAKNFLLQDRMFESVPSYSKMSHLFMVSGWSANCTSQPCGGDQENYADVGEPYGWNEIAAALTGNGKTWKYYRGEDWDPSLGGSCTQTGNNTTCKCYTSPSSCFNTTTPTASIWFWNPLANFTDVTAAQKQTQITGLQTFLSDVSGPEGSFPQASWIVPSIALSEHAGNFTGSDGVSGKPYNAPNVDIKRGEAYTTMLIQQIMKNTALWNSSIVFLAWDDWGGYYDHVRPPRDANGNVMYGLRVPGIVMSPWLGINKLDHQTLSFDAYLALIEDAFIPIGPVNSGMPGQWINGGDGRTDIRELEPALGNLIDEFDFNINVKALPAPPAAVNQLSCHYP
jgi:phospholipase C